MESRPNKWIEKKLKPSVKGVKGIKVKKEPAGDTLKSNQPRSVVSPKAIKTLRGLRK